MIQVSIDSRGMVRHNRSFIRGWTRTDDDEGDSSDLVVYILQFLYVFKKENKVTTPSQDQAAPSRFLKAKTPTQKKFEQDPYQRWPTAKE